MLWLNIMDTADILVLIGQFPEPRASFHIVMCDRGYPYIMNGIIAKLDGVHPF